MRRWRTNSLPGPWRSDRGREEVTAVSAGGNAVRATIIGTTASIMHHKHGPGGTGIILGARLTTTGIRLPRVTRHGHNTGPFNLSIGHLTGILGLPGGSGPSRRRVLSVAFTSSVTSGFTFFPRFHAFLSGLKVGRLRSRMVKRGHRAVRDFNAGPMARHRVISHNRGITCITGFLTGSGTAITVRFTGIMAR